LSEDESDVVCDETTPVQPRAAYALSKLEAEQRLLAMASADFCPVVLRKGTVYGFSPRMRFDLVVNTFVRDALATGRMRLVFGGEMWRPLVEVRDVARAYVACLAADEEVVRGQIFNVARANMRISELALRVREALRGEGIAAEIVPDYTYRTVRSYRVSCRKIESTLGFRALVSVEDAVRDMVRRLRTPEFEDLHHPRFENLRWLRMLEEAESIVGSGRSIFAPPPAGSPPLQVVRR
jgi:nucleoside-diphosphate-sugar epimerase